MTTPKYTVKEMVVRINKLVFDAGLDLKEMCKEAQIKWSKAPSRNVAITVLALVEEAYAKKVELRKQIEALGGGLWHMPTFTTQEMADEVTRLSALPETPKQPTKTEEETTMTTNTNTTTEALTKEDLQLVMESMMSIVNTQMGNQSSQIAEALTALEQNVTQRLNESARYTKKLEDRIAEMEARAGQTASSTVAPIAATTQTSVKEAPAVDVDMDQVVYSADQIKAMESMKNPEDYNRLKMNFDSINRLMGRTVGGVLNNTARFAEKGHDGVDAVSDLVNNAIQSAKKITLSLVDITETTLTSVNELSRSAGHVVVNGVVYTLDASGRLVQPKTN